MTDHAPPAGPFVQSLPVNERGGTPSQSLTTDPRSDASDGAGTGLPTSWPAVALSTRRIGPLVGAWPWWLSARKHVLVASGGCLALALSCWLPRPYRLIYNASNSVPTGFYVTDGRSAPRRGALMLLILPGRSRALAAKRGYLPFGVMALKRIVGGPGDTACAYGARIFLNDRLVATRLRRDAVGRSLPRWTGCIRLGDNQWFVLNSAERSFDSRYIGFIPGSAFRAEAVAL